jgi:hypothetical protein
VLCNPLYRAAGADGCLKWRVALRTPAANSGQASDEKTWGPAKSRFLGMTAFRITSGRPTYRPSGSSDRQTVGLSWNGVFQVESDRRGASTASNSRALGSLGEAPARVREFVPLFLLRPLSGIPRKLGRMTSERAPGSSGDSPLRSQARRQPLCGRCIQADVRSFRKSDPPLSARVPAGHLLLS